jgi:molybdate transport repressor ModE-like protein
MGRPSTITPEKGIALLEAYQRLGSVPAAAREVGVGQSAAYRYLEGTPSAAAPVVVQQRDVVETAGASLFDTRRALEENYRRVLRVVNQLEDGITLVGTDREGKEYYTSVSPAILVGALKETREHIMAGVKLYELLLSVEEARAFQEAVLEAIGEADDATRKRILDKLQERRALDIATQ